MYERGYRTGIERTRKHTEEEGLTHLAEYMHCDFLDVDAPDNSFDAVFAIEALCHAPDKRSVYGEVFRLLKPGACFANYEYWLTDLFDTRIPNISRSLMFSDRTVAEDAPRVLVRGELDTGGEGVW